MRSDVAATATVAPEVAKRLRAGEADATWAARPGDESDLAVQREERHQLPAGGVVVRASSARRGRTRPSAAFLRHVPCR